MATDTNPTFMAQTLIEMGRINSELQSKVESCDVSIRYLRQEIQERKQIADKSNIENRELSGRLHTIQKEAYQEIDRLKIHIDELGKLLNQRGILLIRSGAMLGSAHDNLARKDLRRKIKLFREELTKAAGVKIHLHDSGKSIGFPYPGEMDMHKQMCKNIDDSILGARCH